MAKCWAIGEAEKEIIRSMTECRHTANEIADRLNVSTKTVYNWQKRLSLKASTHVKFGESARMIPNGFDDEDREPKREEHQIAADNFNNWIELSNQTVSFKGRCTDFSYKVDMIKKCCIIQPDYSETWLEIDISDIATFGNELLAIATKMCGILK